ncbi:amino acid adenylation domain-containing protein [Pseudomonas sp. JH-2]|uniref:amino acid adenylation domain-containing protein n=1 Tax=Pseudomonas sp. JH-2 TaxID=3114998 RepID=UPI002E260D2C|nr:amino acid adenylation domain-containing protein [Pseudomonas sp. JH-2]
MNDNPALACAHSPRAHPGDDLAGTDPHSLRDWLAPALGCDAAAIDAQLSLIDQGLDSINLMRLPTLLARHGVRVGFAELMERPTLQAWLRLFAERAGVVAAAEPATPAVGDGFELTPLQQAYWLGRDEQRSLGGVACQLYQELDGGELDPPRLESAVRALCQRHAMLRAQFLADGRQRIRSEPAWAGLRVHDLRRLAGAEREARLAQLREALSQRCLDVAAGQVFDLQLSLLPDGRSRLHLNLDLLVADVLSFAILLRDLAAFYRGEGGTLPALGMDFPTYLAAQRELRLPQLASARDYWRTRLDSLPGPPQLPLAEAPERLGRPRFRRLQLLLERPRLARLEARARAHGLTLASVLACAYAQVLARWSASQRFVLNLPLFDRQPLDSGVAHMVADFSNLVLLEVDLSRAGSFAEQAAALQAQLHRDLGHAAWSGMEVLRELAQRQDGEGLGAPVVFACNLGEPLVDARCRETLGRPGWALSQTPQVWLDHQTYPLEEGLLLNWDAVDGLFPDGLLEAMFAAYERLIEGLPEQDWGQPVSLELPAAQAQVRYQVNDTRADLEPGVLHQGFFAQARNNPHDLALVAHDEQERQYSYAELAEAALRLAAALREWGVAAGDGVAITLPKGAGQVIAVLGVLAAGACYVPVGIEQPPARRAAILRQAGARLVLTDAERAGQGTWPAATVVRELADSQVFEPLAKPLPLEPSATAYVIFTSGSSGEPKGVEVAHGAALNTLDALRRRYRLTAGDRLLGVSALDFDLSVFDLFAVLGVGGTLVLPDEALRKEPTHWLQLLRRHGVTLWNSVPALLDMLLLRNRGGLGLGGLRLALVSGDWIGLDLPPRLRQVAPGCRFVALGGATEAAVWSNFQEVGEVQPQWRSIPYGRPLDNQRYRVVDGLGRDCPDWVAGELWIGGAGVALGYRGQPALTLQRFVEHDGERWYRTGDLGRYWPDGTLEFLGRVDQQVKLRGHRVELAEVEAALERHPALARAVALVLPGARASLVAAVVPAGGRETPQQAQLRDWAGDWLPAHMLPERILALPRLPLSGNGKVDRKALAWLLQEQLQGSAPAAEEEPLGELEAEVARHWRALLEVPWVGRHQGFFALGGNSLLATRLIERLASGFGVELTLKDFFGAASVATQAALVAARQAQRQASANPLQEGAL